MIITLNHTSEIVSKDIRAVFQASYAVEAKLLQVVDFPPLHRELHAFVQCVNTFYGYQIEDKLIAVLELKQHAEYAHIQSLVVLPEYFRRGIGSALIHHALKHHDDAVFVVETGLANLPATALYESLGFVKTKEYDTDHLIRKVAFELKRS